WSWGRKDEDYQEQPRIRRLSTNTLEAEHPSLGRMFLVAGRGFSGKDPALLFTDNETNFARLFGTANPDRFVKDAFHEYVVHGRPSVVKEEGGGTRAAVYCQGEVRAGADVRVELRLFSEEEAPPQPLGPEFDEIFDLRIREADEFYAAKLG